MRNIYCWVCKAFRFLLFEERHCPKCKEDLFPHPPAPTDIIYIDQQVS